MLRPIVWEAATKLLLLSHMTELNSTDEPLALLGGRAVIEEGPPAWPIADPAVQQALERAFADGSWGKYHGNYCRVLASRLGELLDAKHVTLCCSGTFAVELALRACSVGPEDEVLLAGYDFPGNFRSIEAIGARPVLIDVAASNWNLDPDLVIEAIGPATKAILVSHLHGGVVPMQRLRRVADERGLAIVEDACQSPGAVIEGRTAGGWGDVGVLSFGGSKLLSAGRGGAIFTNDEKLHQRAKIFCERGNHAFPLSELQAAVLLPQIEKLAERNLLRQRSFDHLLARCRTIAGLRPLINDCRDARPGYYKLGLKFVADELGGATREDFTAAVRAEGVALDAGFVGFGLRTARRCRISGTLDESRRAAGGMCVLHHPVLLKDEETIDRVAAALQKVTRWLAQGRTLR